MWLENLKELKKAKGMSSKHIAELTNLPERTVARIFSGDTESPYVDTLHRIVTALGSTLDEVFADTKVVVGGAAMVKLQEDLNVVKTERDQISAARDLAITERDLIAAENAILKDKVAALTAENDLLRMQLKHKEEIIAIHNYYTKLLSNS